MKYLDTNILVRLLTNDVPDLASRAIDMIESAANEDIVLLDAVVTETCFILEFNNSYKLPRQLIYNGLHAILDSSPQIVIGKLTHQALDLYVTNPKLDYVDCLLLAGVSGKKVDLLTFDKDLLRAANS